MANQAFGVAICAAALTAAGACATTDLARSPLAQSDRAAKPHAILASMDFSSLHIADHFRFSAADPISASADADPSYALPHETASGPRKSILAQHADDAARERAIIARVAENIPDGWVEVDGSSLRHKPSGLTCPLELKLPEEQRAFQLFEIRAFDQKNLDVGCNYSTGSGADFTLYASFWPDMSLDDSAGGAVEAIALRFQVKGRLPVSVATVTETGAEGAQEFEKPEAAAFDIGEINGVPYKTSLWIVKTHGWHVKARATYPQQDVTAEVVSAVMFAIAHINVRAKNMQEPITAGGEV